jgi:fucose permease
VSVNLWLRDRLVELGASLCTAGVLIIGVAIGLPFLRARIAETFLYGFCCVSAVLLRAVLILTVRGTVWAVRTVYSAALLPVPTLGPSRA